MADGRKRVTKAHKGKDEAQKVRELEQQVSRLKTENDLLKKWGSSTSVPTFFTAKSVG